MKTVKEFPVKDITDIQIKSKLSQINIVAGSSENIVLRWTDTSRRTTTATQFGSALEIKDEGAITLYGVLGFMALKEDKELTLEVPAGFTGSVRVESHDEMVRVFGVERLGSLTIKTTIGAIEITGTNAVDYQLSTMGGNISLRGVTSDAGISAETHNGNIDCLCIGDERDYMVDCYTQSGYVDVPQMSCYQGRIPLWLRTVTGGISLRFMNRADGQPR